MVMAVLKISHMADYSGLQWEENLMNLMIQKRTYIGAEIAIGKSIQRVLVISTLQPVWQPISEGHKLNRDFYT